MKLTRPIRWPGGKYYQAASFVSIMPKHNSFFDTHAGALNVLLEKPAVGVIERVCDVNSELTNFWRVLQNPDKFKEFHRQLLMMPLSQKEFVKAKAYIPQKDASSPSVKAAVSFFVRIRMSRGGAGEDYVVPTVRLRRDMNEQVSAWLNSVDGLPEVSARLRTVEVLEGDALKYIPKFDSKTALFYSDPPYLHRTRVTKTEYGDNEMTDREHAMLLAVYSKSSSPLLSEAEWNTLSGDTPYAKFVSVSKHRFKGMMMLSGYADAMYDHFAAANAWSCLTRDIANSASSKSKKPVMTECLWVNFPVSKEDWAKATKNRGGIRY